MDIKSLQELCSCSIANSLTLKQISNLHLPKALKRSVLAKREQILAQKNIENIHYTGFDLAYCHAETHIGISSEDTVTNRYFTKLFKENIKSCKTYIAWSDHSGYIDLYAPSMIRFTTVKGDTYDILYSADAIGKNTNSNWSRDLKISSIRYKRNNETCKQLKFMFAYGYGCEQLIMDNKPCEYSMPYIALDEDMNYTGHNFTTGRNFNRWCDKQCKIANYMDTQLANLVEEHKSSSLPFFVYFLEFIDDPIMRLIYMFTYMPAICVKSGK